MVGWKVSWDGVKGGGMFGSWEVSWEGRETSTHGNSRSGSAPISYCSFLPSLSDAFKNTKVPTAPKPWRSFTNGARGLHRTVERSRRPAMKVCES